MSTAQNFLTRILEQKQEEIARRRERGLYFRPFWDSPRRDFEGALRAEGLSVIAEIKKASPSKGLLCPGLDPPELARSYVRGGARAISVITDEPFFRGSLEYLAAVREAVEIPLLRKDFILDPIQIEEARAFGADAVLLIVAALSPEQLKELLGYTRRLGLSALVEVHDEEELETALSLGARIIGVNNRNLHTFQVSVETTLRLLPRIPADRVVVAESGLSEASTLRRLREAGVHAALVGEALVKSSDPEYLLRSWLREVNRA